MSYLLTSFPRLIPHPFSHHPPQCEKEVSVLGLVGRLMCRRGKSWSSFVSCGHCDTLQLAVSLRPPTLRIPQTYLQKHVKVPETTWVWVRMHGLTAKDNSIYPQHRGCRDLKTALHRAEERIKSIPWLDLFCVCIHVEASSRVGYLPFSVSIMFFETASLTSAKKPHDSSAWVIGPHCRAKVFMWVLEITLGSSCSPSRPRSKYHKQCIKEPHPWPVHLQFHWSYCMFMFYLVTDEDLDSWLSSVDM